MAKVTNKLEVTLPKTIADKFGIRPGDEVEWIATPDSIQIVLTDRSAPLDLESRLRMFDEATRRQREREAKRSLARVEKVGRGWTREDLYDRARPD